MLIAFLCCPLNKDGTRADHLESLFAVTYNEINTNSVRQAFKIRNQWNAFMKTHRYDW